MATGIGSVPFLDIKDTCQEILRRCPAIPFWPQFPKRSFLEDMSAQYCEGLPLLTVDENQQTLSLRASKNAESELTTFYEHFLARDVEYFAISKDNAPGLYTMLNLIDQQNGHESLFLKGQTVGPITFAAGILDAEGKPLLHNTELLEAMLNGLAIKALWQIQALGKTGKRTILFMDEPYLSGFGSAFSAIQRHEVIQILRKMIDYLREYSDALIGIHCCGNTDWPMIIETGIDIINFDAFEFLDHFLLYPDEIIKFIRKGGSVAWGIVPTSGLADQVSEERLFLKIREGVERIHQWGLDPGVLAQRSLLTPACGMGTMVPEDAKEGMVLLSTLSSMCKDKLLPN